MHASQVLLAACDSGLEEGSRFETKRLIIHFPKCSLQNTLIVLDHLKQTDWRAQESRVKSRVERKIIRLRGLELLCERHEVVKRLRSSLVPREKQGA